MVWGSASGKCPLLQQISLESHRLLYLQTQHAMSQTSPWNKTFSTFNASERVSELQEAQCFWSAHNVDWDLYLTETNSQINFDFLLRIEKLMVQFLWGCSCLIFHKNIILCLRRNVRLSSYRREPDRFELLLWQLEEWRLVWPQQRFPLDLSFILSFYIPSKFFILQGRGFC